MKNDQAATLSFVIPSSWLSSSVVVLGDLDAVPELRAVESTSATSSWPFKRRQRSCADARTPSSRSRCSARSTARSTPKALTKLDRDWTQLTAFYDYPAEHWRHLRTTTPIESAFATSDCALPTSRSCQRAKVGPSQVCVEGSSWHHRGSQPRGVLRGCSTGSAPQGCVQQPVGCVRP